MNAGSIRTNGIADDIACFWAIFEAAFKTKAALGETPVENAFGHGFDSHRFHHRIHNLGGFYRLDLVIYY